MIQILLSILVLIVGYLIGSISPAYLLGKAIKRIDIRKHGSKNAGTMNAWHIIGWWAGLITLLFDLGKGFLSVIIALLIFGIPIGVSTIPQISFIILLAGFATIIGHVFPFYLKFKGGMGAATAYGLMILVTYYIAAASSNILSFSVMQPIIIIAFLLVFLMIVLYMITRSGNFIAFIGIVIWFFILAFLSVKAALWPLFVMSLILAVWLISISYINVRKKGGLKKDIEFTRITENKKKRINIFFGRGTR